MSSEIVGNTFNSLTVTKESDNRKWNAAVYDCLCICGKETQATKSQLLKSAKKSCGCARKGSNKGSKYKVEVGQRFERLLVTSEMYDSPDGHYRCNVLCDCGESKSVTVRQLNKGLVVSCGCKRETQNYIHGMSSSRPNSIYGHMKRRCDSENEAGYPEYGGRGIIYQDSWSSFAGFWKDMEEGYSDDLELDRIDVHGNYTKDNCRWVDHVMQCFNTRKRKDNTSGKSGVSWNPRQQAWEVYINIHRNRIRYGFHKDLELAIHIREEAELKYYGFIKE